MNYCKWCGSTLGLDCGEAEPDFNEDYCSLGCHDADASINPSYYTKGFEVTKFIQSWDLNFCEANVIRYVCRWRNKNGLEDLLEAKKYLEFLIENKGEKRNETTN